MRKRPRVRLKLLDQYAAGDKEGNNNVERLDWIRRSTFRFCIYTLRLTYQTCQYTKYHVQCSFGTQDYLSPIFFSILNLKPKELVLSMNITNQRKIYVNGIII